MKKILGLDLGSASIGWAMIQSDDVTTKILGLGSRIIPYEGNEGEGKDFDKGTGESRNSVRTKARSARRGYDRYQLRRKSLVKILVENKMYPGEEQKAFAKMDLWNLRNRSVTEKISLQELGRLLLWLNQRRGYKSSRSDANLNKKDTESVAQVKTRHQLIREKGMTIGQYFYNELEVNSMYRVKENVFPREAYIEEFDAVCAQQQKHYSELTNALISEIRNKIIYYQRPLKSQKGLVSVCEFESREYKDATGKVYISGPKVAPKSSPIFQLDKMWQNVNNIKLEDKKGQNIIISKEKKLAIFEHLNNKEKLTLKNLQDILDRKDFSVNKQLKNGIEGNTTKWAILQCLGCKVKEEKYIELLKFNYTVNTDPTVERYSYDKRTGEILDSMPKMWIDADIEKTKYNMLWHTIYAIKEREECKAILMKTFDIEEEIADKLASLDFVNAGFGNKSAKVMRNILPYLMLGEKYDVAMQYGGYDHSNSMTKEENNSRILLDKLKLIAKNSLRQPVVEKILNQTINVVNAVIDEYGKPDEIRIELARELKQSKKERKETYRYMRTKEKESAQIVGHLAEYGVRATRNNIIKWRLFYEISGGDSKLNGTCIYCGQPISLTQALNGDQVEIEHIIPKSKLFDDSQSNKTLAHRKCNSDKNNLTAYDFMKSKSKIDFDDYVNRVNDLYNRHIIGRAKRDKLLMSENKIPQDFIDRQLRESQYIARKAKEIMSTICKDVISTSGDVTARLRRLWGWDDITMQLQIEKYKNIGLTSIVEWTSEHGKNKHKKEIIPDFGKRNDHRHHAIDALVIACTKRGYIQRLNTLSSTSTRNELEQYMHGRGVDYDTKLTLLEKYLVSEQPLSNIDVAAAVDNILISFKAGKKAATFAKRKIGNRGNKKLVQSGIIVPRGALHEESVYGKIQLMEKNKPLKYIFQNPDLIVKHYIKELVVQRLNECEQDVKKAVKSLEKNPIFLDKAKSVKLEYATCFKHEYVIKYAIDTNFTKIDKVLDPAMRAILQRRLAKFGGQAKEAFKDVRKEGQDSVKWYDDEGLERPIHSVRCITGLSAVVPVRKDESGIDIGFVKPCNNHHTALYRDSNGKLQELTVTFWHAVERKKHKFPIIIKNPMQATALLEDKDLPESFLANIPDPTWTFEQSLQLNEMFVLGMDQETYEDAIHDNNLSLISKYLYRVQSLSQRDYSFRFHVETVVDDVYNGSKNLALSQQIGKLIRVSSLDAWSKLNPHKIKISLLGKILDHD